MRAAGLFGVAPSHAASTWTLTARVILDAPRSHLLLRRSRHIGRAADELLRAVTSPQSFPATLCIAVRLAAGGVAGPGEHAVVFDARSERDSLALATDGSVDEEFVSTADIVVTAVTLCIGLAPWHASAVALAVLRLLRREMPQLPASRWGVSAAMPRRWLLCAVSSVLETVSLAATPTPLLRLVKRGHGSMFLSRRARPAFLASPSPLTAPTGPCCCSCHRRTPAAT